MFKNKTSLTGLVILLALIGGMYYFFSYSENQSTNPVNFEGALLEIRGDTLLIRGSYEGQQEIIETEIIVNGSTKISKSSFVLPKNKEEFTIDDLPKEESVIDFSTFEADSKKFTLGLKIELTRNFMGKGTAKEIKYNFPKY
jgi:hypothetical protein